MDDSMINPILLSSSIYLKNVEQLIENLEKQTCQIENLENIFNNHNRQEIDTKSFLSLSSNDNENFLIESIIFPKKNFSTHRDRSSSSPDPKSRSQSNPPSSATSWRQMKESQRITTDIETKETRTVSPLNLYKIFQQKSSLTAFQSYQQQHNSLIPNHTKSKSYNSLTIPTSIPTSSLPDLSFLSKYSQALPTTSPTPSSLINSPRLTLSPSDRPRTLKSIKRYKNSKHSTEPLGIFSSPQLRQTFTTVPTSLSNHLKNFSREHHSGKMSLSNPTIDHLSLLTKLYGEMRRCQTDISVVDPILHRYSLTDSPPNEFRLYRDDDEISIEQSPNLDESVPFLITMNHPLLERINDIIKRLFEIKRSNKTFFLNNEDNLQLDSLLKNDLCPAIQNILEHGRKDLKKITLWKIIQLSIEQPTSSSTLIPGVYHEAKQIAQNISSFWLYKFQAFIFVLLNKNELINWLYYFTRQKDLIQRYYQSPDALILVSISSTFNLFERIMTQLEKLTSLAFHLTYHPPSHDEQFNTSMSISQTTKASARDWVMTLSRRNAKNFTPTNSNTTFRSTLSKRFNAIFTKTNSSVVATKLPEPVHQSIFTDSTGQESPIATFQSKLPRPSLNVDKPKSVRYRSTTFPSK